MRRLRHPIRAIREPFGTAGLIVAMIALVAALGGTAFAAAKLNSTQKKEVEKIAKKYAGNPGAPGAQGPTGPAGAAGKDGTNGTNGKDGANGTPGTPGTNGKSVAVEEIQTGGTECGGAGGAFVEEEGGSTVEICNGAPWAAGGTLPKGRSESGTWDVVTYHTPLGGGSEVGQTSVSFGIPLKSTPIVKYVGEGEAGTAHATECPGTPEAPKAAEGFLCVYISSEGAGSFVTFEEGVPYTSGSILKFTSVAAGLGASGTWAVTSAG